MKHDILYLSYNIAQHETQNRGHILMKLRLGVYCLNSKKKAKIIRASNLSFAEAS